MTQKWTKSEQAYFKKYPKCAFLTSSWSRLHGINKRTKRAENGSIPWHVISKIPKMDQMGENMKTWICRPNVGTFSVFWANSALLLFCLIVLIWLYLGHFHPLNMILPIYHFSDHQIWDRSSDRSSKILTSDPRSQILRSEISDPQIVDLRVSPRMTPKWPK